MTNCFAHAKQLPLHLYTFTLEITIRQAHCSLKSSMKTNLSIKRKARRKRRLPLVSVIMPVYNSDEYLDKAIKSVLSQSFKDFELIILDDHSSDKSWDIIKRYTRRSKRIRALRNYKKLGLPISVKHGLELALGDYITKIDSDDLCYKTRFEKQVKYLNKNRRTVAVGTQYLFVNERGKKVNKKMRSSLFEKAYEYVYRFLPVQQPALMIAKKRLPRNFDFYNYGANSLEDIELVYKLSKYGKVENLPYTLLRYRLDNDYSLLSTLRKIYFLFFISRIKGAI